MPGGLCAQRRCLEFGLPSQPQRSAHLCCRRALHGRGDLPFRLAASPPRILNLSGPKISIRRTALKFGELFGVQPRFTGVESESALISDGTICWQTFGPPKMSVEEMIARIARWLKAGHDTWAKPTHFEVRDGKY